MDLFKSSKKYGKKFKASQYSIFRVNTFETTKHVPRDIMRKKKNKIKMAHIPSAILS